MTLNELEAMLATISTQRMGEVLTMKMPEDKSTQLGEQISTLTQRLDSIEAKHQEDENNSNIIDEQQAMEEYFKELTK